MGPIRLSRGYAVLSLVVVTIALLAPNCLHAQLKYFKKPQKPSDVKTSLGDYLTRARALGAQEQRTTGSLWSPSAPLSATASDYKARHAGDLLVIRVVDNFSATNNGSAQGQRTFNASSGVSAFLGNSPDLEPFAKSIFAHVNAKSEWQRAIRAQFDVVDQSCRARHRGAAQWRAGC